jgi:hypothetical protein
MYPLLNFEPLGAPQLRRRPNCARPCALQSRGCTATVLLHLGLCTSSQIYGLYLVCISPQSSVGKFRRRLWTPRGSMWRRKQDKSLGSYRHRWHFAWTLPDNHILSHPHRTPYRGGGRGTSEMKVGGGVVERCCWSGDDLDEDLV